MLRHCVTPSTIGSTVYARCCSIWRNPFRFVTKIDLNRNPLIVNVNRNNYFTFASKSTPVLLNNEYYCLYLSKRLLAKGKDRKKERKSDKPKVVLDVEEMNQVLDFDDFQVQVDSIIEEMKNDLKLNYNIRLNPRLIEELEISYDGINVKLSDIVTITRKQNDMVLNFAATPNAVKPAAIAIGSSGLNLNPQQDGHIIYITMPKVTTEHRQALIKSVRNIGQKVKDKIKDRNFQKKFFLKMDKKLSEDLIKDVNENIVYYIKQKSLNIDDIINKKIESLTNN